MAIEIKEQFKVIFSGWFSTVREINKKYAKPRIKMTRGVSFALFALRIYLLILVGLLFYKFITIIK